MPEKIQYRPGICIALLIFGILSIVAGALLLLWFIVSLPSIQSATPIIGGFRAALIGYAFQAFIYGVVLLAISKAVELLAEIKAALNS